MKRKLVLSALLALCVIMPAMPVTAAGDGTDVSGTVPLVIYDVHTSDISNNSATILWKTNGAATSQVFYDTQYHGDIASYAYHTLVDTTPVSEHSVHLTSLTPSTTYHYRAKSVASVNGTEFTAISEDYTFTTSSTGFPPIVFTLAGWPLSSRSAIVYGILISKGSASSVEVYFQWGKTKSYGSETRHETMYRPGIFFAIITNLTPSTRYHFRAVAAGNGTSYGYDSSFTTYKWWW